MVRNVHGPRRNGELRVLVTRYWARGHRRNTFVWLHMLSPSAELLAKYKRGDIDWRTFAGMYVAQLASDETARRSIRGLHDIAASGERDVVLYCHEKPGIPCHRHLLREMVLAGRVVDTVAGCTRFVDADITGGMDGAAAGAKSGAGTRVEQSPAVARQPRHGRQGSGR